MTWGRKKNRKQSKDEMDEKQPHKKKKRKKSREHSDPQTALCEESKYNRERNGKRSIIDKIVCCMIKRRRWSDSSADLFEKECLLVDAAINYGACSTANAYSKSVKAQRWYQHKNKVAPTDANSPDVDHVVKYKPDPDNKRIMAGVVRDYKPHKSFENEAYKVETCDRRTNRGLKKVFSSTVLIGTDHDRVVESYDLELNSNFTLRKEEHVDAAISFEHFRRRNERNGIRPVASLMSYMAHETQYANPLVSGAVSASPVSQIAEASSLAEEGDRNPANSPVSQIAEASSLAEEGDRNPANSNSVGPNVGASSSTAEDDSNHVSSTSQHILAVEDDSNPVSSSGIDAGNGSVPEGDNTNTVLLPDNSENGSQLNDSGNEKEHQDDNINASSMAVSKENGPVSQIAEASSLAEEGDRNPANSNSVGPNVGASSSTAEDDSNHVSSTSQHISAVEDDSNPVSSSGGIDAGNGSVPEGDNTNTILLPDNSENGLASKIIKEYPKYLASTTMKFIAHPDIIGHNQYYVCTIDPFKIMEKLEKLQIRVYNKLTSFLYGKKGSLVFLKRVLQCVGYINSQDAVLLKYKSIFKVTEIPNNTRQRQFQNTTFIFEYLVNEAHDELLRRYATYRTCMMVPNEILTVLAVSTGLFCTNSAPLFSKRGQHGFNVFIVDKSDKNGDVYRSCRRLYMQSPAERQYVLVTTEVFDAALQSAGLRLNTGEPVVMHERVRVEDPNSGEPTEELVYIIYHPDDCRLFIFIPTRSGSYLDTKERIWRHGPDADLYLD